MNRSTKVLLVGATIVLSAAAQAQTGAQANGQASVQADKTHAQATGGASASSSAQPTGPMLDFRPVRPSQCHAKLASRSQKSKPGDAITACTAESVKSKATKFCPRARCRLGVMSAMLRLEPGRY